MMIYFSFINLIVLSEKYIIYYSEPLSQIFLHQKYQGAAIKIFTTQACVNDTKLSL